MNLGCSRDFLGRSSICSCGGFLRFVLNSGCEGFGVVLFGLGCRIFLGNVLNLGFEGGLVGLLSLGCGGFWVRALGFGCKVF